MNIDCYAIMWNEQERLPWYLDNYHYARNIFLYDNYSTDSTLEIAAKDPRVVVTPFGQPGSLDDGEYLRIKNNAWKGSDADWVIVGDADELLYHPDLFGCLETTGATVLIPSQAYSMFSYEYVADYKQVKTGCNSPGYMKACLFKPSALTEINYKPGCHQCGPVGDVAIDHPIDLVMYHYSHVGFEWVCKRYAACDARRGAMQRMYGWGSHYAQSRMSLAAVFEESKKCGEVR